MADPFLPQELLPIARVYGRLGPHRDHQWRPLPWEGNFSKVLMFDPSTGQALELGKMAAGAAFPAHSHPCLQAQYLVSGRLRSAQGEVIEQGTFNVIPAGQLHGPFLALEETISLKYFAAAPAYVLPDGSRFDYGVDK